MITINVKKANVEAVVPIKAHDSDAAFDLTIPDAATLYPGRVYQLWTGLIMEIPEGWEVQIWPRGSDTLKGMYIHPGTIDAGFRGEVCVLARAFDSAVTIKSGERVGQIKIVRIGQGEFTEVEFIEGKTDRGEGGCGSTGRFSNE